MTTLTKLVAKQTDALEYTTYVFEILDKEDKEKLDTKYIMCTRWPNWDHRGIKVGEIGYLCFKIIQAGIDKWFDGSTFVPYNYTNIQFEKFIDKQDEDFKFKI